MVALSSLTLAASSTISHSSSVASSTSGGNVSYAAVGTYTSYAIISGTPNPNGPLVNPYDSSSLPFTWPGLPTDGQAVPTPRPDHVFPLGGAAGSKYNGPAFVPKEISQLIGALSQNKTNGDSQWGVIGIPPLPISGLPGCGSCHSVGKYSTSPPPHSTSVSTGIKTSTSSLSKSSGSSASKPSSSSTSKSAGSPISKSSSASHSSSSASSASKSSSQMPSGTGASSSKITLSSSANLTSTSALSTGAGSPTSTGDACGSAPDTGVTRSYNFQVSYQTIAPDGVTKNGLVVNGGFPGPLIEANWGDMIEVQVTNGLPDEGTSLHWHGLTQNGTPYYDGVPAVSQCPIAPNDTMTYLFKADLYGTSWYHSHYSAQYAGGALGPMIIYGPQTADYDIDIGPVMLSDWYHQDYFTLVNQTMNGAAPPSNNNLINGKMNYPCANTTLPCTPNAGVSKFQFQSGKKHRLRLINTSAEGIQKFSIDGHTMTVIANDFVPINPYSTGVVTLGVGQRADVVVEATGKPTSSYWMRAQLGTGFCSLNDGVSPNAVAAIYYESANTTIVPQTTSNVTSAQLSDCGNDPLSETTAYCPATIDTNPSTSETINITFASNGTNFVWFMNNSSFRGDYNSPVLLDTKVGNLTFEPDWNVLNFGSNKTVRIIFENTFQFSAHPMHLHGHNFHVLAEGFGTWDGTIVNPNNTQQRDVQLVRPAQDANTPAYIVLEWQQDNPGVWPLHCHIAWHVSAGLYVNVLERPDDIQNIDFPADAKQTCQNWAAYTGNHMPDQIDSGL